MADFEGTANDDVIDGTEDDDDFEMDDGGDDRVNGLGGNDDFDFDDALTRRDRIDGGDGDDTVEISGDYSGGLTFRANSLTSVETIELGMLFNYALTLDDANVAAGELMEIDGRFLIAGDTMFVDASAETDGELRLVGGAGGDVLIGGRGVGAETTFSLFAGGADEATGGDGHDVFDMSSAFDAGDRIRGGQGDDLLEFTGDNSAGFTITKQMMRGIEHVTPFGSFDFDITLERGVIEGGGEMVWSSAIGAGHTLRLDAHRIDDGSVFLMDGVGADEFIGSTGNDRARFTGDGDRGEGRDGDDAFEFLEFLGGHMTRRDRIDGGDGNDTLVVRGDYTSLFEFRSETIRSVETIELGAGDSYVLATHDGNVAAGATLNVSAELLVGLDILIFNGEAETDGMFNLHGGGGDDTLVGGAQADVLTGDDGGDVLLGRAGDDLLTGGFGHDEISGAGGADTYQFFEHSGSTGVAYDVFLTFNANQDFIDLPFTVAGIRARVNTGALSVETFDADLAAVFPNLNSHRAVVFAPDSGNLAGHIFLIVEDGGPNGYQAGEEYVFEVTNGVGLNSLAVDNFI